MTGTDTGVGKTVVSAAMMRRFRHLPVRYWKPVQTGIEQDDDTVEVERLSGCGRDRTLDAGVRLSVPVSPHLAAKLNETVIDLEALLAIAVAQSDADVWIVEGAGGVLVPLNDRYLIVDLLARLELPALVVSRSGLGTINHTLLTLEALERRFVPVAGVVMVGPIHPDNRLAIERYGRVPVVGELPYFDSLRFEEIAEWADARFDVDERLAGFLV